MCDGSMPGGRTCQDLGYAGGTLKCSAHCGWDTSGCTRCAATDDVVRACINAPVDASVPSAIAMDATEQEIALAWTSPDTAGSLRLHFARFAPDLTLISESGPFGPPCVGKIALAARPGGWSLAAETAADLQLLALDATGAMTSVIPVASLWPSRVSTKMVLAHRDGSGPLLAWEDGFAGVDLPPLRGWGHMNLVSADGASTMGASPAGLPLSLELIAPTVGDLAAIPTPVGWLVASDHQSADEPDLTETEIVELSYEANLVKHFAPSTGSSGQPRLAAEDRTFRISRVFQASADGTANHVAPLTYDGLGGFPVALGAPGYINPAPMVLINGATSVFTAVGTGNSPRALHYLQYDALLQPAGILQPVGMPRVIATDIDAIKTYVAARRGPDAVVAWINGAPPAAGTPGIGPSSIGLARVTPQ
jgi:hypothetical protein